MSLERIIATSILVSIIIGGGLWWYFDHHGSFEATQTAAVAASDLAQRKEYFAATIKELMAVINPDDELARESQEYVFLLLGMGDRTLAPSEALDVTEDIKINREQRRKYIERAELALAFIESNIPDSDQFVSTAREVIMLEEGFIDATSKFTGAIIEGRGEVTNEAREQLEQALLENEVQQAQAQEKIEFLRSIHDAL